MIVTAALVWYDERPEDLRACVTGMATVADRLVAVDGAYRRYPDAKPSSPTEQAEAILDTASEVGIDCELHVPDRLWAGQVEKRSFILEKASVGSDWIAVVDTDWIIHGDREAVRSELAGYDRNIDTVTVPFCTPPPEGQPFSTGWHKRESGKCYPIRHFFRALPGLRVEGFHWHYSAIKNGERVWMWHGKGSRRRPTLYPVLPEHELRAEYAIEHRTLLRDEKHILAGRAFCNDRVKVVALTGQEDHVEGLPEPVWDYETVPY